ncbi:MAG: hypothetical protein CMH44_17040 [Muricauda sp.]|nr:hypothetical protein [Allomuricauda sp.]
MSSKKRIRDDLPSISYKVQKGASSVKLKIYGINGVCQIYYLAFILDVLKTKHLFLIRLSNLRLIVFLLPYLMSCP